jgi:hypothetical protein
MALLESQKWKRATLVGFFYISNKAGKLQKVALRLRVGIDFYGFIRAPETQIRLDFFI